MSATESVVETEWFPFVPENSNDAGVIGMGDWLEKPAGKCGPVLAVGDHFEFEDGTPIKFWGINLGNRCNCPEYDLSEFWAARWAKYGINCVRMHKFLNPQWEGIGSAENSAEFDAAPIDRLDYLACQLKTAGIYFGFSHSFHFRVRPGDRDKLTFYDEIAENVKGDTYGLVNLCEEVQDVMIEAVINLLRHRNPYTGLRYAEEPALAFVEMQNEDDLFFYDVAGRAIKACPSYYGAFVKRYNDWLRRKYPTHSDLIEAWGEKAIDAFETKGENLDLANICPVMNGWHMGNDGLAQAKELGTFQRLLDNAEFLHEVQNSFYSKFERAIRGTGYRGPLVGSCWQAPSMLPQYYNLRSDWLVGFIDRHNYYGGMDGWKPRTGAFNNGSQLAEPGTGLLSSGFERVADRPFAFSEWNSVFPNQWNAESPVLIAVYGMGLQDWNASYEFACTTKKWPDSDKPGFQTALHTGTNLWPVEIPTQMGLYPALARMVYRGDVKAGDPVSVRRVSIRELIGGRLGFHETVRQSGDFKEFGGQSDPAMLAAGRVIVEFTGSPEASIFEPVGRFRDADGNIVSTTKQLRWVKAGDGKGHITVDTAGTKAVAGFAQGREILLGDISVKTDNPFAVIILTSLDKEKDLAEASSVLLTAVARVRNTGMRFSDDGSALEELGTGPMLLESMKAEIIIRNRNIAEVRLLDHDGRPTEKTLDARQGRIEIDGSRDRTMYYEIVMG